MNYHDLIDLNARKHLWSMDLLHAQMIQRFIKESGLKNVIEVGCAFGVSTSHIINALDNEGSITLIDIEFSDNIRLLLKKLTESQDSNINVECILSRSTQKENDQYVLTKNVNENSVIILDGDHSLEVVSEEIRIILQNQTRPAAIVLHDTGSIYGCPGPKEAERILQSNGYLIVKDEKSRPEMRTERGLSLCVKPNYLVSAKLAVAT